MNNQNNNGCGCRNHPEPASRQPADINMTVCDRNANVLPMLQTYTTKVLKPNVCCKKNILTQQMISCEGYKYVIKWDFDLNGKTITVPKNCILEFDGGSLKNGTIIGQDTLFINVGDVDIWGENLTREGTWREKQGGNGGIPDKEYDPEHNSGLGRKTLELKDDSNILTQEDFDESNTVYVFLYDFDLDGARINIPENCVLNFEGGSVKNGCLVSNKTKITGTIKEDYCLWGVFYDGVGNNLTYNYKTSKDISSCFNSIMSSSDLNHYTVPQSIIVVKVIESGVQKKYIIIFCINNDHSWIHLFDEYYNCIGTSVFDVYHHCNGACVNGDDVYTAGWKDTYALHKSSLSDIIAACKAEDKTQSSEELRYRVVTTSVVPLVDDHGTVIHAIINAVAWDAKFKQFAVVEDYYVTIYDENFNFIKQSSVSLFDLYDYYTVNQQGIFRNGQYIQMGYNDSEWANDSHTNSLLVIYDCATDTITETKVFTPYQSHTETEGLYIDPDNEDEIYICAEKSLTTNPSIISIGKLSITKDILGVSSRYNTNNTLAEVYSRQYIYVDNSYTGGSDGNPNRPFKTIREALSFASIPGNVYLRIIATEQDYNVGDLTFDGLSFLYIRGISSTINGQTIKPTLRGNISVTHCAAVNFNGFNLISDSGVTMSFGYCQNSVVQYCDFYKVDMNDKATSSSQLYVTKEGYYMDNQERKLVREGSEGNYHYYVVDNSGAKVIPEIESTPISVWDYKRKGTHIYVNTISNLNFEYVKFHTAFDAIFGYNYQYYSNIQFSNCVAEDLAACFRTNGHINFGSVPISHFLPGEYTEQNPYPGNYTYPWVKFVDCDTIIVRANGTTAGAHPYYNSLIFVARGNDQVDKFMDLLQGRVKANWSPIGNFCCSLVIEETSTSTPSKDGVAFRSGFYFIYNNVPQSYGKAYSIIRGNENGNWDNLTSAILEKYAVKSDEPIICHDQDGRLIWAHEAYESGTRYLIKYDGYSITVKTHGATADRPISGLISIGFRFFDETLGKPVYWNGTGWVDATGTTA